MRWSIPVLICLAAAGCDHAAPELSFVLQEKTQALVPEGRDLVVKTLSETFGTPSKPVLHAELPVDFGAAGDVGGTKREAGWKLAEGRALYMVHCVHCHGTSGDGNGPTARFLSPKPRDYRPGVFKFTSTHGGMKASTDDLRMVLNEGIAGTSMPSFRLLGPEKVDLMVGYVRWLAMRGELEIKLTAEVAGMGGDSVEIDRQVDDEEPVAEALAAVAAAEKEAASGDAAKKTALDTALAKLAEARKAARDPLIADLKETLDSDYADTVTAIVESIVEGWKSSDAEESLVKPAKPRTPSTMESLARGRELFASQKAKCADCHGRGGLGNGPLTEDFWPRPGVTPEQKYEVVGLHDSWGNPQRPRNLTLGQYRGGRRPVDIYRRLFVGIKGTQMTGYGSALSEEEIWDLVNYVMSMPYEGKVVAK